MGTHSSIIGRKSVSGFITPAHESMASNVVRSPASVRAMSLCWTLTATFRHASPALSGALYGTYSSIVQESHQRTMHALSEKIVGEYQSTQKRPAQLLVYET